MFSSFWREIKVTSSRMTEGKNLVVNRLEKVSRRRKRSGGEMMTCRVQFQRPRIIAPLTMIRKFSSLNQNPSPPAYDVCLSTPDCGGSMYYYINQ